MKRKIFSVFLALVLACSLSLVTAVPAAAATINVPGDYSTIQEAIDVAGVDDIIIVDAGIYAEDLVIPDTKTNLELVGATGATIKGVQNLPIASWPLGAPNIEILADGVKIHGFTIEGPVYEAGYYASGIILDGTDIEIYDNDFVTTPANTTWQEIAHAITTISKEVWPTPTDVSGLYIHDNTFTGSGDIGSEFIYINPHTGTGTITIDSNQFSGSTNIGITAESGNVIVSNNTISTTLGPETAPYGTYGMRFMDTLYGANGNYDNIVVSGNDISGFKRAIRVGNGSFPDTSVFVGTISSNTLTNNELGVWGRNGSQLVVVGNAIFDNTVGILNGNGDTTPPSIDATGNWWGTTIEAEIAAMVSGDVIFTGWLLQAPTWVEMTATSSPAIPPTVETSAASAVAFTLATLNGNLTSKGTAGLVEVSFGYDTITHSGDPSGYPTWTYLLPLATTGTFSIPIASLAPGETYYFTARAQGDDVLDPVYGGEFSFTTAAITTLEATNIGAYTATLNGHLEIGSAISVDLSFEYGDTPSYGTPATATPPTMTESGDFSADLTLLDVGVLYYFQALGDIGGDIGYGGDKQFTTAPVIGISVSPTSVDFGSITAGHWSPIKIVTVTNEGDYNEIFSTTATNESPPLFYADNLVIDTWMVNFWTSPEVAPSGSVAPELHLYIPIGEIAGAKTATVIFWAEAGAYPLP